MEGGKTPSGQPALENVFLSSDQATASEALLDGAFGSINGDVDKPSRSRCLYSRSRFSQTLGIPDSAIRRIGPPRKL